MSEEDEKKWLIKKRAWHENIEREIDEIKENDSENPDDGEFIHFDEKLWISRLLYVQKQEELISEFVDDIDTFLLSDFIEEKGIPFEYLIRIKKKWEEKLK